MCIGAWVGFDGVFSNEVVAHFIQFIRMTRGRWASRVRHLIWSVGVALSIF